MDTQARYYHDYNLQQMINRIEKEISKLNERLKIAGKKEQYELVKK